jgi:hypothetical protein
MSDTGFAGNSYLLDINANTGAFIAVQAKSTVRQLIIVESQITAEGAANVPQGVLDYQIPNDGTANGFTTVFRAAQGDNSEAPEAASIELGSRVGQRGSEGEIIGQLGQPIIGQPNGQLTTATTMIKLRSGSATGTTVKITELN